MSLCQTGVLHVFMHSCVSAQAELLTGCAVTNVEEAREAARELLKRGCKAAVVTLGPQGCVVLRAQGSTPKHVPPAATVTAVDTTVSALDKGNEAVLTEMGRKKHFFTFSRNRFLTLLFFLSCNCIFAQSLVVVAVVEDLQSGL